MLLVQSSAVTCEVVEGRVVMVDPSGAELITLNPTATVVWQSFQVPASVDEAAVSLHAQIDDDVPLQVVRDDVSVLVEELRSIGLLVEA